MDDDDKLFEDENEVKEESSFSLKTIYYENKKLIWILIIVILLILLMLIFGKSSSSSNNGNNDNSEITLSCSNETLSINDTKELTAKVSNDSNPNILWSSSNSSVAVVDSKGVVTALKEGKSIITGTYKKNNNTYTSTCEINVISGKTGVSLTSVKFKEGSIVMNPNSTYSLIFEKVPGEAMVTSTAYSSTNESVAKVNNNGQVTAMSVGSGTIKVNVNNEYSASINIYVIDKQVTPGIYILPTSLSFKDNSYDLTIGEGKKLTYNNTPNNANLTFIEFSSNNSKVATVDNNGYVKGVSAGDAIITVNCGGVSATTTVHVKNKVIDVKSISISDNNVNLNVGGVHQISANITPSDATDKSLSYKSNDTSIITVNENGQVTALKEGSTYVTVKSNSNNNASTNVFFKVAGGSSGQSSSGGSSSGGSSSSSGAPTVTITSDNKAVQVSYENALKESRSSYPTITITPNGNYSYIKYCTYSYGISNTCTPNISYNGPFELKRTGITVIRAQAVYNGKDGEILTRYVNVKSGSSSTSGSASCYCNSSNGTCTYGAKTGSYTTDVNLSEKYCKEYINRGNQGCFISNGNYIWGSHLGKSSSYVYMSNVTSSSSCNSKGGSTVPSVPTSATGNFYVNWGKSYGFNFPLTSVRILEFKVSTTTNINKVYFCESQSSTKCAIDISSASKKTKHYDIRVLSGNTYDTGSTYNKTFYFEDLSGSNFTFYLVTEKGHSVTLLATDVNKRVSDSFSTTAQ